MSVLIGVFELGADGHDCGVEDLDREIYASGSAERVLCWLLGSVCVERLGWDGARLFSDTG